MASNANAVAGPSHIQACNRAPNQASSRAPNSSAAATAAASKLPTFDFTRRKRWAELLVHELAEAIALVLSPSGKIWFCSPAVSDLLGWRDEELIDGDIFELVNVDDQSTLRQSLDNAVRAQMDMTAYVRLRAKQPGGVLGLQTSVIANATVVPSSADPSYLSMNMNGDYGYAIPTAGTSTSVPALPPPLPLGVPGGRHPPENSTIPGYPGKEVLFELSGYPHVVPQDMAVGECKCIFAVAKPYPSRNTAMLNTFLELKLENERLQEKLADLRSPRTRAAFPRLNTNSVGNTSSAPSFRPNAPFRRPSLSQAQNDGRPNLPPLTTSVPAPNYNPTSAPPYPMSVSMPMDALSSGLYGYTQQGSTSMPPPSAPSHVQVPSPSTYYPMDHTRPRSGSFSGPGAVPGSSSANSNYADYGMMPPTPTDRYNSYAASLGIGGGTNADSTLQQPGQPRLEDRRHSVGGMGLDMRVTGLETLRRQTDGSYTGGPHEVVPRSGGAAGPGPSSAEDEGEERGKKKKRRHAPDQFVCRTCGRTDSPEWRKGPDGPKTLCNACGLRWAKQVRKAPGEEGGKGGGADADMMD